MAEALQLGNGDWVIAYYAPNQEIMVELLDPSLDVISDSAETTAVKQDFRISPLSANGGFTLTYNPLSGGSQAIDFDDQGDALGAPYAVSSEPAPAPLAFTSDANGSTIYLVARGAAILQTTGATPDVVLANGSGRAYTFPAYANASYTGSQITALANNSYALATIIDGAGSNGAFSNLYVTSFTIDGLQREGDLPATLSNGWSVDPTSLSLAGLADGGFVVVWQEVQKDSSGQVLQRVDRYTQFGDDGHQGDSDHLLGAGSADDHTSIQALPDGRFIIHWTSPDGPMTTVGYGYKPALGMTGPPTPGYVPPAIGPVNAPIALEESSGWTAASFGSFSDLVVVSARDGGYGSHVGVAEIYNASGLNFSGQPQSTISLLGYAPAGQTLQINVAPVADGGTHAGFFEVTYAGSTDYEIYNYSGQLVLAHNAYTSQTAAITPLQGGGYVLTDPASNVFGLFDSQNHNLGWLSLPADAAGAPVVHALNSSGFAFTYAGSTHFDLFDSHGQQTAQGDLGAAASAFATGFARDNFASPFFPAQFGFVEAWLSPDGGQQGLPTSLDIQAFNADGQARGPVITLIQDLDPWHTSIDLMPAFNGVNVLWSEGGGVFGARYNNNDGTMSDIHAAVAGDLSQMDVVTLTGGEVGLIWLQSGDVWAEIFDPSTGAVSRADLGAATGDLSTVHALGVTEGSATGMAVSWHAASGVEAAVLHSSGQASAPVAIAGDLIGIDQGAHALAVFDQGGSAMLQQYGLTGSSSFYLL